MNQKVYNGSVDRLRHTERVEKMQVERVVELAISQGDFNTVLDCGTGSGVFAEAFQKKGLKVTGIDLNPEMIAAAKKFVPKATFKKGKIEKLPFSDKSFDLLFYAHSLHEADDLNQALQEAQRVARTHVIALEWPFRFGLHGPPVWHRIRKGKLRKLIRQLGFAKMTVEKVAGQNLYIITK